MEDRPEHVLGAERIEGGPYREDLGLLCFDLSLANLPSELAAFTAPSELMNQANSRGCECIDEEATVAIGQMGIPRFEHDVAAVTVMRQPDAPFEPRIARHLAHDAD